MILINMNNQDMEIKYTVNQICALEERTGKGIMEFVRQENIGFNTMRLLLWAGLRYTNPALTPELTGVWIQEGLEQNKTSFEAITEKCMKALEESGMLSKKEENKENIVGEISPV